MEDSAQKTGDSQHDTNDLYNIPLTKTTMTKLVNQYNLFFKWETCHIISKVTRAKQIWSP